MDLSSLKVKYRYTIEMPDQEATYNEILSKVTVKHLNTILSGKQAILISPIFKSDNDQLIHFILDFDSPTNSITPALYNSVMNIKNKLAIDTWIETTKTGLHLVSNVLLKNITSLKMREIFKKFNINYLDYVSSFRDMPIYRLGSYVDNTTYMKIDSINDFKKINEEKKKLPLDILDQKEWVSLWERFLLPTKIVEFKTFERTSLINFK